MKCHYEVLNVPRDAEDPDIKSAYKKLALRWHPDKNLDNPEEAKEYFQLVQQAYEVLIDKQERAWYDNHREQILRGSNSEFEDNSLNIFPYFTTTCFKGYGDDDNGFYGVYGDIFNKLIEEDMEFFDDKEEYDLIPRFGNSQSDYDEIVGPFYAYWTSYSTKKSYVWLDPYSINETRDRRILKLIEKDNKKVRLKAKKERNEEVRGLVAFVRKRDKRVQENAKKLEAKIAENRKKQEEISKQKRLERLRDLEGHSKSQAEWMKFDNVKGGLEEIEKQLAETFGEENSESDEDVIEDLYCVACNKSFKTEKALKSHENSKKHKENAEILKQVMLEEEENGEFEENSEEIADLSDKDEELVDCLEDNVEGCTKDDKEIDDLSEESDSEAKKSKKRNKKKKNVLRVKTTSECISEHGYSSKKVEELGDKNEENGFSDDSFGGGSKKSKKKSRKSTNKGKKIVENNDVVKNEANEEPNGTITEVNCNGEENSVHNIDEREVKVKKAVQNNKKLRKNEIPDLEHLCVTCQTHFSSKNKLFKHLESTGHSVYIPKHEVKVAKQKKKNKER